MLVLSFLDATRYILYSIYGVQFARHVRGAISVTKCDVGGGIGYELNYASWYLRGILKTPRHTIVYMLCLDPIS